MKQDKWTQQLHDKLAEHETSAPDGLWDDIEAAMATAHRPNPNVSLRRWAVAAAIAALFVGGGLVLYEAPPSAFEGEAPPSAPEGATIPLPLSQVVSCSPREAPPSAPEGEAPPSAPEGEVLPSVSEGKAPPSAPEGATIPLPSEAGGIVPPSGGERGASPSGAERGASKAGGIVPPSGGEGGASPSRSERGASFALYAMNGLVTKDNSNGVMMVDALAEKYATTMAIGNASRRGAPIFLTGYEEREHHHQPVSFGLSVSYPLNQRLSLTSGIVYTRMQSEFTQIIRSQQINKEQTLHYVGIPLVVGYRLWQLGAFKTYVAAGVQADWNVAARQTTEGVESDIDKDKMQWSANASLGLQYNLMPQLAIYAEPGMNHYFDNGSPVRNFFKDKPTSFRLQLGLRLELGH